MASRQCVRCGEVLPEDGGPADVLCHACRSDLREVIVSEVAEHLDDRERRLIVHDALDEMYECHTDDDLLTEAQELGLLDDDTEEEEGEEAPHA